MSLLTHQSAVNPERDFWAKAHKGISSISQVVPNPLPYGEHFYINTQSNGTNQADLFGFANALFIQNPTSTQFSPPGSGTGQVVINHEATEQNSLPSLFTSTSAIIGRSLVINNTNVAKPDILNIPSYNSAGAVQGNFQVTNGNGVSAGEYVASTLQILGAGDNLAIAENIRCGMDGSTYIPNLSVSTINGAVINPTPGAGQYFSSITFLPSSNGLAPTTQSFSNIPVNSICEGFASGTVTWAAPPAAGDYFEILFYATPQTSDQLGTTINLSGLAGATGILRFNIAGFFQSSASATTADLSVQTQVTNPGQYSITINNGNFRVIGPQ